MLLKYEVSMKEFGCMSVHREVLLSREEVLMTELPDALLLKLRKSCEKRVRQGQLRNYI